VSGLRQFFRLPAADRGLLVRSIVLLGVARLALWLLPLRVARRILSWGAHPASKPGIRPEQITWAIGVGRRFIPRADCLPQALAAEVLLLRNAHPATLRIGVYKTVHGRLVAHAWVESGGRIVIGELIEGLSHLTPLPPLPPLPGARA